MKNTGYVRQIDSLGRLVLPIDLRKAIGVQSGEDSVEIYFDADEGTVVLQKYIPPIPTCIFCGSQKDILSFKNQNVCQDCMNELSSK